MMQEEVLREIVEQRRRRIAGFATGEMARVVLDAVAEPHLLHHLEVVERALLEALLLEEASFFVEEIEPLAELFADRGDRAAHLLLRRHVVRAG